MNLQAEFLVGPADAAKAVGTSSDTIKRGCQSKKLPSVLIGKQWVIDKRDLVEWWGNRNVKLGRPAK